MTRAATRPIVVPVVRPVARPVARPVVRLTMGMVEIPYANSKLIHTKRKNSDVQSELGLAITA